MNPLERHFLLAAVIGAVIGLFVCSIDIWISGTTNTATPVIIAVFLTLCITSGSFYEVEKYLKEKYKQ